jgi:hypothetical protein
MNRKRVKVANPKASTNLNHNRRVLVRHLETAPACGRTIDEQLETGGWFTAYSSACCSFRFAENQGR